MSKNTLGDRFKILRNSKKLTITNFADLLGISPGFISLIENDERTLSQDTLLLLSEKLKINLHWLLTGEGNIYISDIENRKLINDKDIPKENIKEWIDNFWRNATDKEKSWLEIEIERTFPEYLKWIQDKSEVEKKLKTG